MRGKHKVMSLLSKNNFKQSFHLYFSYLKIIACIYQYHIVVNAVNLTENQQSKQNSIPYQTIKCSYEKIGNTYKQYGILKTIDLFLKKNDHEKEKITFVKAASGVKFLENSFYDPKRNPFPSSFFIVQDSSRNLISLKLTTLNNTQQNNLQSIKVEKINFFPLDSQENINKYEDEKKDYEKYRKKTKRDFESIVTTPSEKTLVFGSGSDILNKLKELPNFRSTAILIDMTTHKKTIFQISNFYTRLQSIPKIIGDNIGSKKAQLNIEGVTIRPKGKRHIISFFHRGNTNGHNSVVEFDFESWEKYYLTANRKTSIPQPVILRVVKIDFGTVMNKSTLTENDITLNDALYGEQFEKPLWYIPVSVESDSIDKDGNHSDGIVTFSGIARWEDIDNLQGGKCTIKQAPGDKNPGEESIFGKVEGIAAFSSQRKTIYERGFWTENAFVVGVNDSDNETAPSKFSFLNFKNE